jgi:hypothetical protein
LLNDIGRAFYERVIKRRSHYRQCFSGTSGEVVLADLKRFCNGASSPLKVSKDGHTDEMATAVAIGRQEVFNRILHHIHLDDAQLINLKEQSNDD